MMIASKQRKCRCFEMYDLLLSDSLSNLACIHSTGEKLSKIDMFHLPLFCIVCDVVLLFSLHHTHVSIPGHFFVHLFLPMWAI